MKADLIRWVLRRLAMARAARLAGDTQRATQHLRKAAELRRDAAETP